MTAPRAPANRAELIEVMADAIGPRAWAVFSDEAVARAILAALEARGVWLVPVEATRRMIAEGEGFSGDDADEIFTAMIDVSPYAPGGRVMSDFGDFVETGDHARGCAGREYDCTCGYDDAKDAELLRLRARIAELEAERAWRPIAEASAWVDDNEALVGRLNSEGRWVSVELWNAAWDRDSHVNRGVTHFMPLPQPPAPEPCIPPEVPRG